MSAAQSSLTIVTYHYVRDMHLTPFPEIKGLLISKFEKQLDYICRHYEVINLDSYLAYLGGGASLPANACLLTFDDGLKDHYEAVFPRLRARKISGVFFLITEPLARFTVAGVHQIHFLLAKLGIDKFSTLFDEKLMETHPQFQLPEETEVKKNVYYRYDDSQTRKFKKLLNFELPYSVRDDVLGRLFHEYIGDERTFSQSLYLSWAEIDEMKKDGMVFGGHTHTHRVLPRLTSHEKLAELKLCTDILVERLGESSLSFSYPYGTPDSLDAETMRFLADLGYSCAFTATRGVNKGADLLKKYELLRLDTNDLADKYEKQ